MLKQFGRMLADAVARRVIEHLEQRLAPLMEQTVRGNVQHEFAAPKPLPIVIGEGDTHIYTHTGDGHRVFLDVRDHHITLHVLEHGTWEDHVRLAIIETLPAGGTFIDVGGNVGLHSLFAAAVVGPLGKVRAFEPIPRMFNTLVRNFDVNGLNDYATATCAAVADHPGKRIFTEFRSHAAMSGFSLTPTRLQRHVSSEAPEQFEVDVTTLDLEFGQERVDMIKIDVEGYELLVLQGAQQVLQNNPSCVLIIEWAPKFIAEVLGTDAVRDSIDLLQGLGFVAHLLQSGQAPKQISWDEAPSAWGDLLLRRA